METLKPLVDQLTQMIKDGYDFGKGQLPDVAKELLRYFRWMNSIQLVVVSLVFGFGIRCSWYFFVLASGPQERVYNTYTVFSSGEGYWFGVIVSSAATIVALIVLFKTFDDLIRVMIAPKVFLLEYLRSIVD